MGSGGAALVVLALLVVFVIAVLAKTVRIVPQARAGIVERFGKYKASLPAGLNVVVPFLALQPLVENAVRHGLAGRGGGSVEIVANDAGSDCVITVEDDGAGMDPDTLRAGHGDALQPAGTDQSAHVGLTNVDHRLRAAFGNDYGLVVETAIGAGTKVIMRVPKFRSGVRASGGVA